MNLHYHVGPQPSYFARWQVKQRPPQQPLRLSVASGNAILLLGDPDKTRQLLTEPDAHPPR